MRTELGQPIRLEDYKAPDYLIDQVELDVRLHHSETRIFSRLKIRPNPKGGAGAALILDGDELKLQSIRLDGSELDPSSKFVSPQQLTIPDPPRVPFVLEIETITNPAANSKLMGLYRSGSAYCTQCEAEGFRRITYFLDRPDVLSVYTTRIEAEISEAPVLLGNGNRIAEGNVDGTRRHFAIWHDPFPKPCYLFALVGGNLGVIHDEFVTRSGRKVALGIYIEHGKQPAAAYAMEALKRSMAWDEVAFGREYDLDVFNIVAVSDFNMGAMENKGLNIFNDKYVLALPETATDTDYANIEAVIAHEYFHNWTGNRITCRDWFQLCLKEGLTVYRDHEFSSDMRSRAVRRIADVRTLRAQQFPEDAGPLAHNVRPDSYLEINNFYTATIYEKGSEIIRMLRVLIGDEAFRRGMNLYFDRYDGTAATIEEFISCFAEVSQRDLGQFSLWYHQAGTPAVEVKTTYDEAQKTFALELSQSCKPTPGQDQKRPFVIPIQLGLVSGTGGDLPLQTSHEHGASNWELAHGVIELTAQERKIVFHNVPERPVASLLRGFSAPVRLIYPVDEQDLITLIAKDNDPFNSWQAAQTYATRLLISGVERCIRGELPAEDAGLIGALQKLLENAIDPAFAAQVITLPGEADIAREIAENVDPDAIHSARQALRKSLGTGLKTILIKIYHELAGQGAYSPDAASAGRRALRNCALDLIAAGDPTLGIDFASRQFESARTMTDEIASLGVLCLVPGPEREKALQGFYSRHAGDPLVIDKWFALQAMIPESETLPRIQRLMNHQAFSLGNPNRARSLIGAFAAGNQTQFNAKDGSGYRFLSEIVIDLDPKNPQVAARLLNAFRSWRALEPNRQSLAKLALTQVASTKGLSPDVRDIAERSLA